MPTQKKKHHIRERLTRDGNHYDITRRRNLTPGAVFSYWNETEQKLNSKTYAHLGLFTDGTDARTKLFSLNLETHNLSSNRSTTGANCAIIGKWKFGIDLFIPAKQVNVPVIEVGSIVLGDVVLIPALDGRIDNPVLYAYLGEQMNGRMLVMNLSNQSLLSVPAREHGARKVGKYEINIVRV